MNACWGRCRPRLSSRRIWVIATQDASACGVTTSHRLYCWGDNDFGQLGLNRYGRIDHVLVRTGRLNRRLEPVRIPRFSEKLARMMV